MPVSQDGSIYPLDAMGGIGQDIFMMMPADYGVANGDSIEPAQLTTQQTAGSGQAAASPKTSYLWYIAAVVVLLVIIKFASEHEKSGMDPSFVGIGVYNFIAVTFMAILGIWIVKIIANKYGPTAGPASGLTDLINMS